MVDSAWARDPTSSGRDRDDIATTPVGRVSHGQSLSARTQPSTSSREIGASGVDGENSARSGPPQPRSVRRATARPGSRTPSAPSAGTQPVRFDWDDDSTWAAALDGVAGVYVVPPALRTDHPPLLARFAERALAAGVDRLVLLCGLSVGYEDEAVPPLRTDRAALAETVTFVGE